jgi:hypothetical protein
VTLEEEAAIRTVAARLGLDVSTFVRRAVLHELSDEPIDPAEAMLDLFVRTVEAWLNQGEAFTVDRFREICAEVKADNKGRAVARKSRASA